jgi:hypothetical protein
MLRIPIRFEPTQFITAGPPTPHCEPITTALVALSPVFIFRLYQSRDSGYDLGAICHFNASFGAERRAQGRPLDQAYVPESGKKEDYFS